MRLLLSARPAHGHIHPLLPLAMAARRAGHTVVFGTGAGFLPMLHGLGFDAHQVGIAVGTAEAEARARVGDTDPMQVIFTTFAEILPAHTMADLRPLLAATATDLVVYEQSDVGAAAAAALAGIPAVSHIIGRSMPEPMRVAAASQLAPLWGDAPMPADPMLGDAVLDIWPPAVADPAVATARGRIPLRPVAWNPPGPLPAGVGGPRRRPLVYLTLGTVAYRATAVLRAAVAGLASLPVDVLVAVGPGDPAALGALPPRVRVERFVPQAELLAHVDLVVHHGGSGTMLGALAAGLPQLVMPQGADQFANAEALVTSGTGLTLQPAAAVTPEAVAAAAQRLLADPTHRQAARGVAAEIAAMPAPEAVVAQLADLVQRPASSER